MALTAGTKLGPYEIQSPLGAGGMGEVYRACDKRLDRIVAIKILSTHLSDSPENKQRFEREARTISSLNHPHICHLYDVGSQNGTDFLVMEYLEGQTMADRLAQGAMPLPELLRVGMEIAEALEVAHRAGIVHRDLKPGNIMLTKSGAKLMDFGLAKGRTVTTAAGASGAPLTPFTPTINVSALTSPASPLTQKGSIVGTFQYMAPEVLQGAEADARSDLFSFGCVLYEMATGKRAFDGKSQVGVLAAILEKEPEPISVSQPMTPPSLDRLIRSCLAKDPEQRWQSAHDVKMQLHAISEMGSQAGIPIPVSDARLRRKALLIGLGTIGWLLALGGLAAGVHYYSRVADELHTTRAEIDLPDGTEMALGTNGGVVISPDGHKLAFPAKASNGTFLWIRDLETGKASPIAGTEDASFPFWSPDSSMVGFFAAGKLRTIAASGGPVQIICDAPAGRGGTWSQAGLILFTPNIEEGLYKVAEAGGVPAQVTRLGAQGFSHRNPVFLPDGKRFLFTQQRIASAGGDLYASELGTGEPKLVVERASNATFTQGYLLYLRDRNLVAQRFDPASLSVLGKPLPIVENVEFWELKDLGNFSAATSGTLVYRTDASSQNRFAWLRLPGKEIEEFGDPISGIRLIGGSGNPLTRASTDGRKFAFVKREPTSPNSELWVFETDHKTLTRQTINVPGEIYAAFSPDGTRIAISNTATSGSTLTIKSLATGKEEKLDVSGILYSQSWTPDGKYLILMAQDPKTQLDIYAQPVAGGKPIPLLTQSYNEFAGEVSPNGKWMAYLSSESGRVELYVTDFPGAHSKRQISSDGAYWHAWSHDGKHLYFANGNKLLAAAISNPDNMEFSNTETVTTLDGVLPVGFAPDGRLLVLKPVSGGRTEPLRIALHILSSLPK
jgi:serine/threonine protein kinase/DNA-binding beta-propeller fold protein YncE